MKRSLHFLYNAQSVSLFWKTLQLNLKVYKHVEIWALSVLLCFVDTRIINKYLFSKEKNILIV